MPPSGNKKHPYLMFFTSDWLGDPALSQCSLSAQGLWMNFLCSMHQSGRVDRLTGTVEQLSRFGRCSAEDCAKGLEELRITRTAEVHCHGNVFTVVSRRLSRECRARKKNTQRQSRNRLAKREAEVSRDCHADVAPHTPETRVHSPDPSGYSYEENNPKLNPKRASPGGDLSGVSGRTRSRAEDVEIPESLRTEAFLRAWAEWLDDRRKRRLTVAPDTLRRQLAKLAEVGPAAAIEAINTSMMAAWKGVFPKAKGASPGGPPVSRTGPGLRYRGDAT